MKLERIQIDPVYSILNTPELSEELEIVAKWTKQVVLPDDKFEQFVRDQVREVDMFQHIEKNTGSIRMTEISNQITGCSIAFFNT